MIQTLIIPKEAIRLRVVANSDSKYDSITLNYVISNYYNLEYVSLRNNSEGEENEI